MTQDEDAARASNSKIEASYDRKRKRGHVNLIGWPATIVTWLIVVVAGILVMRYLGWV